MVSQISILGMTFSAVVSILLPTILFIYFHKKEKISIKVTAAGAATFVLFAMVLERLLHMIVINNKILPNPWVFGIYGALAAGVFEEGGRFIVFQYLLKKSREWKDGIAFGIGHGGIEAILLGVVTNVQNILFSNMINGGVLEEALGASVPAEIMAQLKAALVEGSSAVFFLGGIERIFAVIVHIALSILVLYGVKNHKRIYVVYAVLAHALINYPAVLFQMGKVNIWVVELWLAFVAVIGLGVILGAKRLFKQEAL